MLTLLHLCTFVVLAAASGPLRRHGLLPAVPSQLTANSKKLSGDVAPTAYTLALRFEEDFAEKNQFSGSVTIDVTVGNLSTPDSSFQFHAKGLIFTSTVLKITKGDIVNATFSDLDPETDFVTVTPSSILEPGSYSLVIDYLGFLSESEMVGLYKSSYVDQFKQKHHLVASQFEEIHARRAFPCFDEPEMKATFAISITYPKGFHARSNGVAGSPKAADNPNLEKVTFNKSPIMSTYLVAILVDQFDCKNGDTFNSNVKVELCSEINAMDASAKTALDATPKILQFMSDFTGYTYGVSDIRKVTLAAIPDFAPGAMENWGLLTFRESILLWYENESSTYNQQYSLTTLAHELSHQWFGNLVTLNWWNDMFLNEGFATYFEYLIADSVEPTWQLPKQFVLDQVQQALWADSFGNSLPLSYDTDNSDFSTRTNDVSYPKGSSVIRMVQHFLGIDNFQTGIARYIDTYKKGTATSAQLWECFQEFPLEQPPPEDMTKIMDSWINKSGYPILTVKASGDDIIISQKEFSVYGETNDTQWYVPITYSSSLKDASDTSTRAWLVPGSDLTISGVIKNGAWVVLNNQQVGFYRVDYDDTLLSRISAALKSNITSIDEMSRSALIDDQFNLAKTGKKTFSDVLNFLTFLKNDDSYFSWYTAFDGFTYLLQRTVNEGVKKHITTYIEEQMETLNKSTNSLQEIPVDHVFRLKQVLLWSWQCKLNEEYCIADALQRFAEYKADSANRPTPDRRAIVYCYGLRNSTNSSDDFTFLWNQYLQTRIFTEKVTILDALGCTSDLLTRQHYLSMALTEDTVRHQDASHVFTSVYSQGPDGVSSTLHFILDNHNSIIDNLGVHSLIVLIDTLAELISTEAQIETLTKLSKVEGLDPDVAKSVIYAIEIGNFNLDEIKEIENSFSEFSTKGGAVTMRGDYFINVVFIMVGYALLNLY